MFVFQAFNHDYTTAGEAIAAVEAKGEGSVVKFSLDRNLPGCLPEFVHHSCGLWTYAKGQWSERAIFSGRADVIGHDKPA